MFSLFISFFRFFVFFSTNTDVAKHESVTQKHLKPASHRTRTVIYMVGLCSFPFHELQHTKDKITALLLLDVN